MNMHVSNVYVTQMTAEITRKSLVSISISLRTRACACVIHKYLHKCFNAVWNFCGRLFSSAKMIWLKFVIKTMQFVGQIIVADTGLASAAAAAVATTIATE